MGCAFMGQLARRTLHNSSPSIDMVNLNYAIRTTPVSPEVMQWIHQATARMAAAASWPNDYLRFTPVDGNCVRESQVFPFTHAVRPAGDTADLDVNRENNTDERIPDATVIGATTVQTLWDFHLVVAFLRVASEKFPELLFSLSDNTLQLCPVGAVRLQAGTFAPFTDWICSEREQFVLMAGHDKVIVEAVWAEPNELQGSCFTDMPAGQGAREWMVEQGLDIKDYQEGSVGEVAERFVRHTLTDMFLAVA